MDKKLRNQVDDLALSSNKESSGIGISVRRIALATALALPWSAIGVGCCSHQLAQDNKPDTVEVQKGPKAWYTNPENAEERNGKIMQHVVDNFQTWMAQAHESEEGGVQPNNIYKVDFELDGIKFNFFFGFEVGQGRVTLHIKVVGEPCDNQFEHEMAIPIASQRDDLNKTLQWEGDEVPIYKHT